MTERTLEVKLKSGLQARQAALFVQEANRFSSDIYLEKGTRKVNAKSIMGIMSLAIGRGVEVTLSADGHDEEEAVEALSGIIEDEN
ncbi:HPr family phosphocarrier protein [Edaphobacillus lindanitolerans]|uniref:Catabolite repression HPr-like protein n=1 Tax=Edaphobacillus lindanitolerans TaxID=550447 RepID=A0A1U7PMT0_9BACI|nr:HPr family phosphocarrier protein [Edaphobacillus lindanitolerans]SIT91268.1 catabolite repression HPr-like protein [Edaphobacillus lindanitolerans]